MARPRNRGNALIITILPILPYIYPLPLSNREKHISGRKHQSPDRVPIGSSETSCDEGDLNLEVEDSHLQTPPGSLHREKSVCHRIARIRKGGSTPAKADRRHAFRSLPFLFRPSSFSIGVILTKR